MASSFTLPSPKTSPFSSSSSSSPFSSSSSNSNPSQKPSITFRSDRRSNPSPLPRFKLHAAVTEVVVDKSSNNNAPVTKAKSEKSLNTEPAVAADAASVSAFMTQVADLVKLVDSRDIIELELKQLDCEVVIRKKEALQQNTNTGAPVVMMQPQQQYQPQPPFNSAPISAPSPPAASSPVPAPKVEPPKPKSSHPPMKCPMAGTFYRSPAPGAAPFVKVGDKVQKGQVVCIIEAMKLMNEIEADQSGTVVEIIAEDGKPVSVDTPLFVVEP